MSTNDQIFVENLRKNTRLPNWHTNEIPRTFKTSAPLTHALGIIIVNELTWVMF